MARLVDLDNRLQKSVPSIRVYKERCVLNESACSLLGLSEQKPKVFVRQDGEQAMNGRDRIYIGRSDKEIGYEVKMRGRSGRINSAHLSRQLSQHLSGYGVYRICKEVKIEDGLTTYYEIFFRRYS